jgi:hypothetical protein
MAAVDVRKGMPSVELSREEFEKRYRSRFTDPAFEALQRELWPYPRHLNGRHFAVVVHGDAVGAETLRRSLSDWLTDMSLVQASRTAEVDGYIGYMEPYATSHEALDKDEAFQQQTRNAARALGNAVNLSRAGKYQRPDEAIEDPNPK